jgi:hypothetical protein
MVDSALNKYPIGTLDYDAIRPVIPFANLPLNSSEAKIYTGSFLYSSDGITYTLTARSTNSYNQHFTARPSGIVRD